MEKRIYVGLLREDKPKKIKEYLKRNPQVKNIVYFYPVGMAPLDLDQIGSPVEYRTFWEVVRYMYDTPLHEKVDNSYLLIYDEMLRLRRRTDITYNTCHHVANQTNNILLFQYLPIIDSIEDYMILVDFVFPWKWKMRKFDEKFLKLPEVELHPRHIRYSINNIGCADADREKYQGMKKDLFDNLGKKDPDTIPRALQLYAGSLKKKAITEDGFYLARNKRFGTRKGNVHTWNEYKLFDSSTQLSGSGPSPHHGKILAGPCAKSACIIDSPISPVSLPDFLRQSSANSIEYISTGLPVDNYYAEEMKKVFDALEKIWSLV